MESAALYSHLPSGDKDVLAACCSDWLEALQQQRKLITADVQKIFEAPLSPRIPGGNIECNTDSQVINSGGEAADLTPEESLVTIQPVNLLKVHALHRRRLYLQYAKQLTYGADAHTLYKLLMWCHDHNLFIHPSLQMVRRRTAFRDHVFVVREDVARLTPLLAIPEALVIGFKEVSLIGEGEQNCLYDEKREREFNALNAGSSGAAADICHFFFSSLGMIVSDLVTAKSSPLSDTRYFFAESLTKARTLHNAPYLEDDVAFSVGEPCLADVLLQMIRNYINGGPLVNKIPRQELQWAVSICLSHSTPLTIDTIRSIGIIPMVHIFPHGGSATNAYLVARTSRRGASRKMAAFFRHRFAYDFDFMYEGKWIYVVTERALRAGEEVHLQAMAPVCDKDSEAEQMWKLSCGGVPADFTKTAETAQRQWQLTNEIIHLGEEALARRGEEA